ncbi:hypothetical protein FLA105534_00583 [Flavobacterium bizetiae]|uniref:Peptidase S74 domain-containing protein n=2 Tax=Flavobacterium bizetiae TaxID=2704140 RepID=A0A6J4G819_9FLAO|nr:hypothetical protein [Flavobacterium bizetiae]CAA9195296.1 hypothetical protein FLA105534_00583 [Flavobacterium bizetiae]CAD5341670.1 hypothetical protein FLA105535_01644 [Flavobacterium bizetiae]
MKNKLLSLFLFLGSYAAYSQVGIGTPMPNASSQLEVVAADKGVLIPKISLTGSTDATTITNGNVNSLLVFNTATISDIKPGYYYWYNSKWNRIVISTEIAANPGTVIYNPNNQQFTYIDASGNTQNIDIGAIVKANETVTSLINNGGGSYTYTNEAGTALNIDVVGDVTTNFSTIVNNPAVTTIIQDIVNKTEGNVSFDTTTNQFTYVDNSGNTQIVDISTIVKANETITTLDKDPANNGQYTYTSENATTTKIDVVGDVVNNSAVILNNPAFITELTNIIKTTETLTTLVYDKAANTLTYKDEDENLNTINLLELVSNIETKTTLVYDPVAKTLTYNGESGIPTVINLVDLVGDAETVTTQIQNPTTGVITYTNEAGTATTAQVTSTDAGNILTVGSDGGSLLTPTAIANATTVSNTSAVNNLSTTVNGVTGTAVPIVNSNETSLTAGKLTTTVNGVASTPLDLTQIITIDTDNTLTLSGNTLTSTVNGVPASSDAVSGVANASAVNTSTVTVNGITSTGAPIINTNETSLTGASLTTTVNGVASTALDLTPAIAAGTTNTLGLTGNTLTSTVNGVASTSAAVSGVSNASAVNTSTVTVNGITSTGAPIINSNETSLTGASLITAVNGIASTALDLAPAIKANETVTTLAQDLATGTITYNNEAATPTTSQVISANPGNVITAGTDGGGFLNAATIKANETITTINPIVNSGSIIATYTNEAGGTPVEIQQSVTKQSQDPGTGIISFFNEDGISSDANVISTDPANIITVGPDGGALLTPTTLAAATSVSNTSAVNNLSTTVNGVTGTAVPVINSNATSLTGTNLTTTVNGVASTALDLAPAITAATTNTLGLAGNTLTSTVNGVASTSNAVSGVSNASAINTATVTVNGVTSSGAPIINSNATSLTGSTLTTTVNGVASTALDLAPAIKAGETITTITPIVNLGSVIATYTNEAGGVPVEIQQSVTKQSQDPGSGIISFLNEDGFTSDANVISTNPGNIITIGTDGGALLTPTILTAATTNTLTAVNGNLVSTVNGVASTPAVPVLIAADNGLTAANGNVQLGGTLIAPTTIVTDFANTLAITGLMHGMPMDEILVTDPGGGVIRTIKPDELNQNDWHIFGNSNTDDTINFIGTTDDKDLVFKRDNDPAGLLNRNNTSFGVFALNIASTGAGNTSIGRYSLFSNTSGFYNSAIGENTLYNNTTGGENTATGHLALTNNTTGNFNTSAGYASLSGNTLGGRNTAFGYGAGGNNTEASNNTFLGASANLSTLGLNVSNATAIGYNAKVATSNSLVLGGTGADAVNVGIGTDAPENTLHIKPVTGADPIRAEGLQPSVSGTDNIVVADASGVFRTVTPSSLIPATTVSNSSLINSLTTTVNGVTGTGVNIINSNTTSLTGANLNTSVNGVASTALNLTPAIKAAETVTTITPVVTTGNTIANYVNEAAGTPVEVKETVTSLKDVVTQVTDPFGQLFDVHTLTYTDEASTPNPIDLSVLVKGVETLTSLVYDGANHSLIYSDEKGNASEFKMVDLIGESETLTTLEVNATTGTLDYINENKVVTQLDLGAAVKEPWFSTTTHMGATLNTEDIYTNGWVGIGYTTASGAPNEKLRVNGAISTVNTYYADYVFEDYFNGKSEIKSDYKFKRLPEIEDYIKKYNHLPGITPINRLEKTKEGYAFNMSELSIQLLEKTEEIYLHIIEQNKEIEAKDKEIKELKEASKAMNLRLEKLEKLIAEKNN